jgi:ABC-type branched-subunit amino acid transport system ATPase component/ABC-type branched-subunit amino acid transport system permease subunit
MAVVSSATSGRARVLAVVLAGPAAALVAVALVHGGRISPDTAYNWGLCAVYGMVVLSVSLLASWSGVWSIGHPAMFAMGSYAAVFGSAHGWSLEETLVVAAGLPALCGALLGYAGARFSVLYIALLTMAFDLVVLEIVGRWTAVTGGDQGAPVGTLSSALGLGHVDAGGGAVEFALLAFGAVLGLAAVAARSGIRLRAVAARSHAAASRSVGIAPELQTAFGFALSGAVAGVAGTVLATMTGYVSPDSFSLGLATNLIAASVLGGVGSLLGAVVGGTFLTYAGSLAQLARVSQPILQGGVLIAVLLLLPRGVVPSLARLGRRLAARTGLRGRRVPTSPPVLVDVPAGSPGVPAAGGAAEPATAAGPLLVVEDLGVSFGGLRALAGVSLEVRAGEVLAVIGPNGAGKTTLINLLSGLLPGGRATGRASLRGADLRAARPTARRRLGLGRTFQHAELFADLTILENVLCTRRWATRSARRQAMAALERVGLAAAADRLPRELPFGLHKRADLARAVAQQPDLLVLDEPFGGLDAGERAVTAALIGQLRRAGVTIMIVDHVIEELFPLADRVVAFDFGTPVASGPPAEILDNPQVRASYFGTGPVLARPRQEAVAGNGALAVRLRRVEHHYDGVTALRGIDLDIPAGSLFGIVGANGAGKSTLGRIVAGKLRPTGGSHELPAEGGRALPSLVPEGRALFVSLTLRENLEVAAYGAGLRGRALRDRLDGALEWLPPRLRDRLETTAGSLSGGEQQLVAIARGLVCRPTLLVLDEPALGLAPTMVEEVYARIVDLVGGGLTVVLLEQLLARAMASCGRLVVLRDGALVDAGSPADSAFAGRAEAAYLGTGGDVPRAVR